MNCLVAFSVKIIVFHHINLEKDSKNNRFDASKKLKDSFKSYEDSKGPLLGKLQYIVRIPSQQKHMYHHMGEAAGIIE